MAVPLTLRDLQRVRFPMARRPGGGYLAGEVDDLIDNVMQVWQSGGDHRPLVQDVQLHVARRPNEGYAAAAVDAFIERLAATDPAAATAPRPEVPTTAPEGEERWGVTEHRSIWQRLFRR